MKKRILLIFFVVLLIAFSLIFFRKISVFNNIERNLEKCRAINNYYIKINYITGKINDNNFSEYMMCDNIKVINQDKQCQIQYSLEESFFIDKENNVYLKGPIEIFDNENFYDIFYFYFKNWTNNESSIWGQIELALKTQINLEEYNNKTCYKIKVDEEYIYIDANTLLIVARGVNDNILEEYEIEFNILKKEDFMRENLLKNLNEIK